MAGKKGRSGGSRAGSGRRGNLARLAAANPARCMELLDALYTAGMKGSASAQIAYLRAGGHFRKRNQPKDTK